MADLGNAEAADRMFRKALELDPDDSLIKDALGELAQALKR